MNTATVPLLQVIAGLRLISLHCCHQKNKIKSFSRPARSHIISLWRAWALISWNLWHVDKRGTATGPRRILLTICENRSAAHQRRTAVNVCEQEDDGESQPSTGIVCGDVLRARKGRLVGIRVHLAHTSADGVLWQPPKWLKLDENRALGFRLSGESGTTTFLSCSAYLYAE